MKLDHLMKTIVLAGIGSLALTYEKAKELVDELVRRGDISVKEGKALLTELKEKGEKTVEELKKKGSETVEELKKKGSETLDELVKKGEETVECLKKDKDDVGEGLKHTPPAETETE